ncbi:plasmid mobilization protein [Burkholderia ubonensis]|uniref:plasmid mobilization protein n=1 Tax=Burkholderia ubonensis TaxID=101571 RepID=UPI0007522E33|nr:plasmid mobilization relaxosome protein MobC [Burkholderia ubonensis]KWE97892.1 mobilization protein [Burkholderia ubonensis]
MAKKKGDEELGKTISCRLTPSQTQVYMAKVRASGLTSSEFLREAVIGNRTTIVAKPKASIDRKRVLFVFNKTSNNLNQLAHRANADHVSGKLSEASYLKLLDQLQMISRYLKATLPHVD